MDASYAVNIFKEEAKDPMLTRIRSTRTTTYLST